MDPSLLSRSLDNMEQDATLLEPEQLMARADALDWLGLMAQSLARRQERTPEDEERRQRIAVLERRLAAIDKDLFSRFRARLADERADLGRLRRYLDHFTAYRRGAQGYLHLQHEGLDVLLSSAWETAPAPDRPDPGDRDQVHYEPAPASVILELIDRLQPAPERLFVDLGSGLGRPAILYHLLTGGAALGIEIEPAFCHYARQCALSLGLTQVRFVCADARRADLSEGDLFFMFTPFVGEMLQAVLRRLERVATGRQIAVCSYGPCTPVVARQGWLQNTDGSSVHEFRLTLFVSR